MDLHDGHQVRVMRLLAGGRVATTHDSMMFWGAMQRSALWLRSSEIAVSTIRV